MRCALFGSLICLLLIGLSACGAQSKGSAQTAMSSTPAADSTQLQPAPTCETLYGRLGLDAQQAAALTFSGPAAASVFDGSRGVSMASAIVVHDFTIIDGLDDTAPAKGTQLSLLKVTAHPNAAFKANALSASQRTAPLKGQPYLLYVPSTDVSTVQQVPLMSVDEAKPMDSLVRSGHCVKWS